MQLQSSTKSAQEKIDWAELATLPLAPLEEIPISNWGNVPEVVQQFLSHLVQDFTATHTYLQYRYAGLFRMTRAYHIAELNTCISNLPIPDAYIVPNCISVAGK